MLYAPPEVGHQNYSAIRSDSAACFSTFECDASEEVTVPGGY
jgi:hypothetical protein